MHAFAEFLRSNHELILREWDRQTAQLPSTEGLSPQGRRDHIPEMLEAMASAVERSDTTSVSLQQLPLTHADERWLQDFDLREIVDEYRLLRRVILGLYATSEDPRYASAADRLPAILAFSENIDHAIANAVDHCTLKRDRVREYFIGMLSHDLRDPLSAIVMNAQIQTLTPGMPPAEVERSNRIRASASKMQRLIDDMLDVTRARLGRGLPITPVEVDLRRVLPETVDELAQANPGRTIECHAVQVPGDLIGQWDPLRISQAVSNLVANAIKHGADPIQVIPHDEGDRVTLEVRSGGEIPLELRPHIFTPFETRDPQAGIGLGLHIVAEIAKAHRGQVALMPDTPGETRFMLTLPRYTPGSSPAAPAQAK